MYLSKMSTKVSGPVEVIEILATQFLWCRCAGFRWTSWI